MVVGGGAIWGGIGRSAGKAGVAGAAVVAAVLVSALFYVAVSSPVWRDFSTLLASVPVLLGQNAYSRDFEREADRDAIAFLRANGVSPAVMAVLFERLAAQRAAATSAASAGEGGGLWRGDLGFALASHPDDAERVRRFLDAARWRGRRSCARKRRAPFLARDPRAYRRTAASAVGEQ